MAQHQTFKVPPPPPGKRFLLMVLDADLVETVESTIANGAVEAELTRRVEETMRQYLQTRPIDIHLPPYH